MTTNIIMNPFTPIPQSEKSHVRGWAMLWAQRLNANVASKNTTIPDGSNMYIDHGVNFSGSMNLFGGFTDDIVDRLENMIFNVKNGSKLYSLDCDINECDYPTQIAKRIGANTTSKRVDNKFVQDVKDTLSKAENVTMSSLGYSKAIIGDSHSGAYSTKDQMIFRTNGQLLHTVLKNGLITYISKRVDTDVVKNVDICLGSIDIRFHAVRLGIDPHQFASIYADKVNAAEDNLNISISVCAPVPIEYEGRKIPKTGQYEGQNFYGSREERLTYTKKFIEELLSQNMKVVMPPEKWYDMDGEQYAKEIMELSSSVHIAPANYRSILGWNN
jgi:hypothetical protein